jgi:hypothetical protein
LFLLLCSVFMQYSCKNQQVCFCNIKNKVWQSLISNKLVTQLSFKHMWQYLRCYYMLVSVGCSKTFKHTWQYLHCYCKNLTLNCLFSHVFDNQKSQFFACRNICTWEPNCNSGGYRAVPNAFLSWEDIVYSQPCRMIMLYQFRHHLDQFF